MSWKSAFVGAAVTAAAFVVAGRVFSGDAEPKAPAVDTSSVTAEHEALKAYEGSWDAKGKLTMEQGSSAVTGRQTAKLIMGGRFLQLEMEVAAGGATIKTLEFIGFDAYKKKYVHLSMEDDSTIITQDEGAHDAAKKAFVMHGSDMGPDGKPRKFRYTIGDVAAGKFHVDYFIDEGAGEYKMLEWDLTKK